MHVPPTSTRTAAIRMRTGKPVGVRRWVWRLVGAVMLVVFVPVVSAALICDVHCIAQALTQGDDGSAPHHHGADASVGSTAGALPDHLHKAGSCHMPTAVGVGTAPRSALPVAPTGDVWLPDQGMVITSIVWPPPQPRPKPGIS